MNVTTLSHVKSTLGEGAFWHPERQSFFWFDILGKKLFEWTESHVNEWVFNECASAAGWVDKDTLLIASQTALLTFNTETGAKKEIVPLEAENLKTRSNDGRADPQGGFWIGTMGFKLEFAAGAIYRYYKGELRKLYTDITIPNAICFSPDGKTAYFTDTAQGIVKRVSLDSEGWPTAEPEDWLDLAADGLNPDGAVIDADGNFWNAQWGAARVAVYDPSGALIETHDFPASQISCPCLGGTDFGTLFATSAAEGLPDEKSAGMLFSKQVNAKGKAEPRVLL